MAPSGMTETEFQGLLDKVNEGLSQASLTAKSLHDSVMSMWDWLPPWLRHDITSAVDAMWHIMVKLFDYVKEFIMNPGWPPALWRTGDAWTNQVGAQASSVAGEAMLNAVQADDHWQGPAATAYKNTLPAQNAALTSIKSMCDALDTALKSMAGAIVVFWLICAAAIFSAVAEFFGEQAAADTGVGAPPAIAAFIASIAKLLGIITTGAAALWMFTGSSIGPYTSINQQLNNWNAFPPQSGGSQGDWPQATTPDTADGSFSDGNPSKWRFLA
jgi:hypothetical protein